MDRANVIKGMEQFRKDLKPFCGNKADWERFDAGLALLKEQEAVVRCKDCQYWDVNSDDYAYGYCWKVSPGQSIVKEATWFCADGRKKDD